MENNLLEQGWDFVRKGLETYEKLKQSRPPQDIIPRCLFAEQRILEIQEAQIRYNESGKEIPDEWITEKAQLIDYMMQRELKSSTKATDDVKDRIKSFRNKNNGDNWVRDYRDSDLWNSFTGKARYRIDAFINEPKIFEIYSALSKDKVEWKIGDVCKQGVIKQIITSAMNNLVAVVDTGNGNRRVLFNYLTKAEEKKFLFTLDGVKIFDETPVWIVWLDNKDEPYEMEYEGRQCDGIDTDIIKHFNTKEKALEYISRNKKSISYQELHDFLMKRADDESILEHFKPKNT